MPVIQPRLQQLLPRAEAGGRDKKGTNMYSSPLPNEKRTWVMVPLDVSVSFPLIRKHLSGLLAIKSSQNGHSPTPEGDVGIQSLSGLALLSFFFRDAILPILQLTHTYLYRGHSIVALAELSLVPSTDLLIILQHSNTHPWLQHLLNIVSIATQARELRPWSEGPAWPPGGGRGKQGREDGARHR